ncbi:hypothetical protein E4O69_05490 [Neisseria meningitidis]|nr:hypothetical protein [Neisseria meningitidis]
MINSVLQPKNNHLASFPRRRESISEFGQSLFKSDELSFINESHCAGMTADVPVQIYPKQFVGGLSPRRSDINARPTV